jgi:redox-sensing transcriptional repressor
MLYHRFLADPKRRTSPDTVTSAEMAEAFDIDPTQVRKDLGAIGLRGRGRVGFPAEEAFARIHKVLGFDRTHLCIVVGAGHLGGALMAYSGFAQYGLRVVAAFDRDPEKIGKEIAGCQVRHPRSMRAFIVRHRIRLALLATPADAAQAACDRLVAAGITAIWNFAPVRLTVPRGVCVRNEHISLGLSQIAHHLTD